MPLVSKPDMNSLWAGNGARVQPTNTKIETGWTAEIPPHQWENWIQHRQDQAILYLMQRGIPTWDNTTDYEGNGRSVVVGSDGYIYQSVQATGPSATVVNPVTNTTRTHWKPVNMPASTGVSGPTMYATHIESIEGITWTKAMTPAGLREGVRANSVPAVIGGRIQLPGGFKMQWGASTTNSNGTLRVTFPQPFATFATVLTTPLHQAPSSGTVAVENISRTGFNVYTVQGLPGSVAVTGPLAFNWFAIGDH